MKSAEYWNQMKSLKVPVIIFARASDANEEYVGQLTTPVGWGKNADSAGGITPDLNVSNLSTYLLICVATFAPTVSSVPVLLPILPYQLSSL